MSTVIHIEMTFSLSFPLAYTCGPREWRLLEVIFYSYSRCSTPVAKGTWTAEMTLLHLFPLTQGNEKLLEWLSHSHFRWPKRMRGCWNGFLTLISIGLHSWPKEMECCWNGPDPLE
jgi:hypothetical protein